MISWVGRWRMRGIESLIGSSSWRELGGGMGGISKLIRHPRFLSIFLMISSFSALLASRLPSLTPLSCYPIYSISQYSCLYTYIPFAMLCPSEVSTQVYCYCQCLPCLFCLPLSLSSRNKPYATQVPLLISSCLPSVISSFVVPLSCLLFPSFLTMIFIFLYGMNG